jgi:hypothetical protein
MANHLWTPFSLAPQLGALVVRTRFRSWTYGYSKLSVCSARTTLKEEIALDALAGGNIPGAVNFFIEWRARSLAIPGYFLNKLLNVLSEGPPASTA